MKRLCYILLVVTLTTPLFGASKIMGLFDGRPFRLQSNTKSTTNATTSISQSFDLDLTTGNEVIGCASYGNNVTPAGTPITDTQGSTITTFAVVTDTSAGGAIANNLCFHFTVLSNAGDTITFSFTGTVPNGTAITFGEYTNTSGTLDVSCTAHAHFTPASQTTTCVSTQDGELAVSFMAGVGASNMLDCNTPLSTDAGMAGSESGQLCSQVLGAFGSYNTTISQLNGAGTSPSQALVMRTMVFKPASMKITDATPLSDGCTCEAYTRQLNEMGATAVVTWSISAGTLPSPLTINSSTGKITGTPSGTGTSSFTVQATDGTHTATKAFTIKVGSSFSTIAVSANLLSNGLSTRTFSVTAHNGDIIVFFNAMTAVSVAASIRVGNDTNITDNAGTNYFFLHPGGSGANAASGTSGAGSGYYLVAGMVNQCNTITITAPASIYNAYLIRGAQFPTDDAVYNAVFGPGTGTVSWNVTTPNLTVPDTNELLVAAGAGNLVTALTPDATYTNVQNLDFGVITESGFKAITAAGTNNVTWGFTTTKGNTASGFVQLLALRPALAVNSGCSATPVVHRVMEY